MTPDKTEKVIRLPTELVDEFEERSEYTRFESVDAYLTHLFEEILYEMKEQEDLETKSVTDEEIQNRLKSLGYLED